MSVTIPALTTSLFAIGSFAQVDLDDIRDNSQDDDSKYNSKDDDSKYNSQDDVPLI